MVATQGPGTRQPAYDLRMAKTLVLTIEDPPFADSVVSSLCDSLQTGMSKGKGKDRRSLLQEGQRSKLRESVVALKGPGAVTQPGKVGRRYLRWVQSEVEP